MSFFFLWLSVISLSTSPQKYNLFTTILGLNFLKTGGYLSNRSVPVDFFVSTV